MTFISSLAMWFSNSKGKVVIEWFGWQVTTSPSFLIISLVLIFFFIYILLSLILSLYSIPKKTLLKIEKRKKNNAITALNEGIIASFYGNKKGVLKNLNIAKKSLNDTPLLILLELQSSLYKGDQNNTFTLLTKMLDIQVLKPLAIKSLIAYSIKNKDQKLFNNILNKSLDKKIDFSWIQKDIFKFCNQNNNWNDLSSYLEKKISINNKTNKKILSIAYFQIALEHYYLKETNTAKSFLSRALKLNNFFPPFMDLYCKLNLEKNQNKLIKVLKKYWLVNPNPSIEQCLKDSFTEKDALSKLKIISKILVKNNHLYYKYLILGKLKYEAKIWGSSKNDLQKSISFKPSKEAYYFLYKIEKKLKKNEALTQKLKSLYDNSTNDVYWKCNICKLSYNNWYSFCNSCNSFNSIQSININENNNINKNNQLIDGTLIL
ncbi:hypothetical protein N9V56_00400 [Alphaproteobacteria bacterium]|nr:hypothetical protein [Alphaproteobacteria bacterium]